MSSNYIEIEGVITKMFTRHRFGMYYNVFQLRCKPMYKKRIRANMEFYLTVISYRKQPINATIGDRLRAEGFIDQATGSKFKVVSSYVEVL